jgi:hypothetical protein
MQSAYLRFMYFFNSFHMFSDKNLEKYGISVTPSWSAMVIHYKKQLLTDF